MLTSIIIILIILSIIFIPIIGIILGFYVAIQDKSKWEKDNSDANILLDKK